MITRIFIDNYRCFTNFEFVPGRLNLLLGANGAGKSSFFDLLTELHIGLSEIQPWLVELDTRFEDRGQVFIASQNPEVIDYMSASHPFMLERPDGGPTRVRPASFDRESGLSPSSQLARGLADEQ